ncbi:MAG: aquaporin [Bacteroidia bacterium]|nr:aquaporin [Bacteroidia bacterium]NNF30269.1 hypothetical protein [Flavobacteriaceae bacterium]MBT8277340.1 aquaporin [Bacteroidia bacterium]NNJ81584.1 hypothetical protein [Flavobacteriaceae bacterium]NNK54276.1 hypothetical protein [Flavobacteriaceae bacterium]
MSSTKKYLAEGLGTFALVLFGCGAAAVAGVSQTGPDGIGLLGISLAFGLAVQQLWLFIVAPVAGGIFAAVVRKLFIDD